MPATTQKNRKRRNDVHVTPLEVASHLNLTRVTRVDQDFEVPVSIEGNRVPQDTRLPLAVCWGLWFSISALLWMLILELVF